MKTNSIALFLFASLSVSVAFTLNAAPSHRPAAKETHSAQQKAKLAQAKKAAAQVRQGTTRAVIEKLYPYRDGGAMSIELIHYYLGDGVMVDVPFDMHGGEGKKQNRVNGPLRVYFSEQHLN